MKQLQKFSLAQCSKSIYGEDRNFTNAGSLFLIKMPKGHEELKQSICKLDFNIKSADRKANSSLNLFLFCDYCVCNELQCCLKSVKLQ